MASRQYQFVQHLGQGVYGSVDHAIYIDPETKEKRDVVIKRLSKTMPNAQKAQHAFENEAAILQALQPKCSDHILCYIDKLAKDADPESYVIVTEYLPGYITLRQFVKRTDGNTRSKLLGAIAIGLIDGLSRIHESGVAHRDIKPQNIMISPTTLDVKFIDFGLACKESACNGKGWQQTWLYKAPEILNDELQSLAKWQKGDIWALGMVIVEVRIGDLITAFQEYMRSYFEPMELPEADSEMAELFMEVLREPKDQFTRRLLLWWGDTVDIGLNTALKRMLAADPKARSLPDTHCWPSSMGNCGDCKEPLRNYGSFRCVAECSSTGKQCARSAPYGQKMCLQHLKLLVPQ